MDPKTIENTVNNLKKNNFEVHYFENQRDARDKIMEDLKGAKSISRGGSVTVNTIGLIDEIKREGLPFTDYSSPEDRQKSVSAQYYLTSSNAVSEDGKLINIDGAGNRVAAMSYGPERVLVVVGTNKIVKDVDEGIKRIQDIAAPINAKRLNRKTPCVTTGKCSDCDSDDRICRKTHIVLKPKKGRYSIYMINEELGY